jgi:hypothetical protein
MKLTCQVSKILFAIKGTAHRAPTEEASMPSPSCRSSACCASVETEHQLSNSTGPSTGNWMIAQTELSECAERNRWIVPPHHCQLRSR